MTTKVGHARPEFIGALTGRGAHELARIYGYDDEGTLAESLPLSAKILDVGAGRSDLGSRVASERSDISWVNLDFRYKEECGLREGIPTFLGNPHPDNVSFLGADAVQLSQLFPQRYFDRIFSYYMLPYIFEDNPEKGMIVIDSMLRSLKEGGLLSIGPAPHIPESLNQLPDSMIDLVEFADKSERGLGRITVQSYEEDTIPLLTGLIVEAVGD